LPDGPSQKQGWKADIPYGQKTENGLVFREIRTTAKTSMSDFEIDQRKIDAIFGHAKQGIDKYYLQLEPESLIELVEQYAQWLDSQGLR